jgi:RNA polymerase sigma-70 factor (ECF subfamily)
MQTLQPNLWIDKYSDFLYSYAVLRVSKTEDAEDLVQEALLSAFKNKENFRGDASEKTWLTSILKNKIIDYYRSSKNRNLFDEYINETEDSFQDSFFNENNFGRWKEEINQNYFSKGADAYLISNEFQKYLELCLTKLPTKLKSVFIAKYIDDDKAENICKEFEISSSNYWVMVFRAKTILRTCLEKKGLSH